MILTAFHGFCMALADSVPGVSGGTIAFIPFIAAAERTALKRLRGALFALLDMAVVVLTLLRGSSALGSVSFASLSLLYIFLSSAVAITAMVLPGISGSSLLMSCGLCLPVIAAMKDLLQFQFGQFWLLAAVELGVLAGFAIAPHCIRGWMRKAPGAVTYAVLGMMLSSLYAIVVGPTTLKVPQHVMTLSDFHILWFVLGIAVMLGLEALKRRVQKALAH